jgi:hypothetical protein
MSRGHEGLFSAMAFSPSSSRSAFLPPLPLRIYRQLHAAGVSGSFCRRRFFSFIWRLSSGGLGQLRLA